MRKEKAKLKAIIFINGQKITSPNDENLSLIASCNLSSASSSVISAVDENNRLI